jgi:cytochrome c
VLTVGSYWPYATTLWDYTRRAMPYLAPGALTTDQVYALTAFLLSANDVIPADLILTETTLPRVRMPNREGFVPDPRPDVPADHPRRAR